MQVRSAAGSLRAPCVPHQGSVLDHDGLRQLGRISGLRQLGRISARGEHRECCRNLFIPTLHCMQIAVGCGRRGVPEPTHQILLGCRRRHPVVPVSCVLGVPRAGEIRPEPLLATGGEVAGPGVAGPHDSK
jgi:hypothetical protein